MRPGKRPGTQEPERQITGRMNDYFDLGGVPPEARRYNQRNYAKLPADRAKQGIGDLDAETRTVTRNLGKYSIPIL